MKNDSKNENCSKKLCQKLKNDFKVLKIKISLYFEFVKFLLIFSKKCSKKFKMAKIIQKNF